MKTLTMRDLNRKTASVLDALERGETFELRRNGKAVGYLTHTAPPPERKADWKAHFDWLATQKHFCPTTGTRASDRWREVRGCASGRRWTGTRRA